MSNLEDLRAVVTRNSRVRYGVRLVDAQSNLIEALETENRALAARFTEVQDELKAWFELHQYEAKNAEEIVVLREQVRELEAIIETMRTGF